VLKPLLSLLENNQQLRRLLMRLLINNTMLRKVLVNKRRRPQ